MTDTVNKQLTFGFSECYRWFEFLDSELRVNSCNEAAVQCHATVPLSHSVQLFCAAYHRFLLTLKDVKHTKHPGLSIDFPRNITYIAFSKMTDNRLQNQN